VCIYAIPLNNPTREQIAIKLPNPEARVTDGEALAVVVSDGGWLVAEGD
jgi:hypothetical protein